MKERPYGESRLRRAAEARGFTVSHQQFQGYLEAGLIPPPDEYAHWRPDVVDMLVEIRKLGETVRPLALRLIVLFGDRRFDHITTTMVCDAIIAILRSIESPHDKMLHLHAAALDDERKAGPEDIYAHAVSSVLADWQPPRADDWPASLRLTAEVIFDLRLDYWIEQARRLDIPTMEIPFEERIALLAVRGRAADRSLMGEMLAGISDWLFDKSKDAVAKMGGAVNETIARFRAGTLAPTHNRRETAQSVEQERSKGAR